MNCGIAQRSDDTASGHVVGVSARIHADSAQLKLRASMRGGSWFARHEYQECWNLPAMTVVQPRPLRSWKYDFYADRYAKESVSATVMLYGEFGIVAQAYYTRQGELNDRLVVRPSRETRHGRQMDSGSRHEMGSTSRAVSGARAPSLVKLGAV